MFDPNEEAWALQNLIDGGLVTHVYRLRCQQGNCKFSRGFADSEFRARRAARAHGLRRGPSHRVLVTDNGIDLLVYDPSAEPTLGDDPPF